MKSSVRPKILFFFLFLALGFTTNAQLPNPVSFNTAVDAALIGTIPLGSNDLSWTASTLSINGPYVPAVRASNQTAWLISPYATADWITYPHNCQANPVYHSCVGGQVDEYFRLMFTLPAGVCNGSVNVSAGYCLTMNYFADNYVSEIFVNGSVAFTNTTSTTPYNAIGFTAGTGATVTLCDGWHAGTNTLVAHVKSGIPTLGFLAFTTASATAQNQFTIATTQTNVSCFGAGNGNAMVNLIGYPGAATYTWLPGGSNSPGISNLTPGTYTVNMQFPLCNFTSTIAITEPAPVSINVSTFQTQCIGAKVTYTASGGTTYLWVPGNLTGPTVTLTVPYSNTVYTVTSSNGNGCSASQTFTLRTQNCDGIVENSLQAAQVLNSTTGGILVATGTDKECSAEIFDLNGHLVYRDVIVRQSEIDVSNLPSGIYTLRLTDKNSSVRKRVVVGR